MRKRRRYTQRGTSAAELLVASSVIISLSFGVATFLPAGFKSNQNNRERMVSSNLFHQIMEEVEKLDFEHINTGTEVALGSNDATKTIVDTTDNNVTLTGEGSNAVVSGSVVTVGKGDNARSYPHYFYVNNTAYRVDIKVVKGRYDDLMAVNPSIDVWTRIEKFLSPAAMAASVAIQVNPGAKTGYLNTTPFDFTASCTGCPNPNKLKYSWNVDGKPLPDQETITGHLFNSPGDHTLSLSVSEVKGKNSTLVGSATPETIVIKASEVTIQQTPASPKVGDTVNFTADCTECGASPTFEWDKGDGTKKSGQSVSFVYNQEGTNNVLVKVSGGANPYAEKSVTIGPAATGPESTIQANTASGIAGNPNDHNDATEFKFAVSSTGYKNKVLVGSVSYTVDYGDGSAPETKIDNNPNDDQFPVFSHYYFSGNTTPYVVNLTTTPLAVPNGEPPIVGVSKSSTQVLATDQIHLSADALEVVAGSSIQFSASTNERIDITGAKYNWDFGDGAKANNASDFQSHQFDKAGPYTVTVQALGGTQPSTTKQINVIPPPGAVPQTPMKKIYVFVRPWSSQAQPKTKPLASGMFLKGNSSQE